MEETPYLFASPPATPKDKPADILIKFQAVGREHPAIETTTLFLSSKCTLLETRRIIHKFFSGTYDRGFIFLQHGNEVQPIKERVLRLIDIMPRLPLGMPNEFFKYPGVQYKKLCLDKEGRRTLTFYAGIVFLYESSTQEKWRLKHLQRELVGDLLPAFTFVPANLMSALPETFDNKVDLICEKAAVSRPEDLTEFLCKLEIEISPTTCRDRNLATPLHYAASSGKTLNAEILVGKYGRELLYLKDMDGKTPLHCAIYMHRLEVVAYFIHLGPDVHTEDKFGQSCEGLIRTMHPLDMQFLVDRLEPSVVDKALIAHFLAYALSKKDMALCKRLSNYACPYAVPTFAPPLHQAAEIGDEEIVQILLKDRVSPRHVDLEASYGSGRLDLRSSVDVSKKYQRTISNDSAIGIDTNTNEDFMRSDSRRSIVSLRSLDLVTTEVLYEAHSKEQRDFTGHLPFHYACQHGHDALIQHLYYEEMNGKDFLKGIKLALWWRRFTTLYTLNSMRSQYALSDDVIDIVINEIEKDLEVRGPSLIPLLRQQPVYLIRFVPQAAVKNSTKILELLRNMEVPLNRQDLMGRTALHEACQKGQEVAARYLLMHGVDPNVRDWRGSTPLHYACAQGQLDVVTVLASQRDIVMAPLDCTYTTPCLLAAQNRHDDTLLYLIAEHGHRVDILRHNAVGDSVLNHLNGLHEDLLNIILDAAAKHKGHNLGSDSIYPCDVWDKTEIIQAWSGSSSRNMKAEKYGSKGKETETKLLHCIKCTKCKKSFSSIRKKACWIHFCQQNKKIETSVVENKPHVQNTDQQNNLFVRKTTRLPLFSRKDTPISPLDTLIIQRQYERLPELLKRFPELGRAEKSWALSVRRLDVKPLRLFQASEYLNKDALTRLLQLAMVQAPTDVKQREKQRVVVKFLLKMGANPNLVPDRNINLLDHVTPKEKSLLYLMPLEIAAVTENVKMLDILLEFGASTSVSFAVHFAAHLGNLHMLEKLLPSWKEGRWKPYIKGFKDGANELVRICTLESGLLQAVCSSKRISLDLLQFITNEEKGVLTCKKVLTHHMVSQIRPDLCHQTPASILNKIVYKHSEDPEKKDTSCQNHLYITNLFLCKEMYHTAKEIDEYASFLIENECYLGEIRVSKRSTIHVVCESFSKAVRRKLWGTVHTLLLKSGNTLWKCLASTNHTCHKFVYRNWSHSEYPCLSSNMLDWFRVMPLNLLRIFFQIGKNILNNKNGKQLSDKIKELAPLKEDEVNTLSGASTESVPIETVLKDLVLYYCKQATSKTRGQATILTKLTMLFPVVFPETVELIRRAAPRYVYSLSDAVEQNSKKIRTKDVVKQKITLLPERRLAKVIEGLPHRDIAEVKDKEMTILHVLSVQNELQLFQSTFSMVLPELPSKTDKEGRRPMDVAACRANIKMLELISGYGARISPGILVATCVGKGYLGGLLSASSARTKDSAQFQTVKCNTLNWLVQHITNLDFSYIDPTYGSILDVILTRESWKLLAWLLDNAEKIVVTKLLAKTPHITKLAYAPEELLKQISNNHAKVLSDRWEKSLDFVLGLTSTLRPRIAEHVMKKMQILDKQGRAIRLLTHKGRHGETVLHNACKQGNASLVKSVISAAGKGSINMKEVKEILDPVDKAGCTPLWYSLSNGYWKISEFLIINGATNMGKWSVTGLYSKKVFPDMLEPAQNKTYNVPKRTYDDRRGNSSNIAELICPDSKAFAKQKLDLASELKICAKESNSTTPKKQQGKGKVMGKGSKVQKSTTSIDVMDDMESIGYLASPRSPIYTPRSARTNPLAPMRRRPATPRYLKKDATEDELSAIKGKRRMRYLLSLVRYAVVNQCTLVHVACAFGNLPLLNGIVKCDFWSAQRDDRVSFSPFIFALANVQEATSSFCTSNEMPPVHADPFVDVLCYLILKRSAFEANHSTLRRLLNRFTIAKETIRGIKTSLINKSKPLRQLLLHGVPFESLGNSFSDEYIVKLIQQAIQHEKGRVSNQILITMATIGSTLILTTILSVVEEEGKRAEMFKRKLLHNATVIDLLFILAPTRSSNDDEGNAKFLDRMKILASIAQYTPLEISARTVSAAARKNLIPMLELIVKDHARHNLSLKPPELWYEVIFKAAKIGDINCINAFCMSEINTKAIEMQAVMLKALCLACLNKHRHVVNRLLVYKIPLAARIEQVTGRLKEPPKLALECAIQGGDMVVSSLILQTMEDTGMYPKGDDMLRCICIAFYKGMEPIIDNLLQFAHKVSPSLVSLKVCHMLFLTAARKGKGTACTKFLGIPGFNINATDEDGFTALHYAAMHGKANLIHAIMEFSTDGVNLLTPEKWTMLDLARAFGQIELSVQLVTNYGAIQGRGFGSIVTQGWLSRYMMVNAVSEPGKHVLMAPVKTASRSLDIVSLIENGNDLAAKCFIEVAQETVIILIVCQAKKFPLLHMCAKSGCSMSLDILLKLISAQPSQNLEEHLLKEVKGKIPLCVAIENCNIECVKILKNAYYPTQWRYKPSGESLLHFAAKSNKEDIINEIVGNADSNLLQTQDKDGLIPAATSVALGHHETVKYFLNGLKFAEKLHHSHTTTTYWCVLCLLDCAFGWSDIFLRGKAIQLNGRGRNIFQRHRTESGFYVDSHRGSKAQTSHILQRIESWLHHGASPSVQIAALSAMQYSTNGFKSELFLLLSHMTRFEAMSQVIQKGNSDVACYLYEKLCPTFDINTKAKHFVNAAAYGREAVVKKILDVSGVELAGIHLEGAYSALDTAVAFGQKHVTETLQNAFDSSTSITSLNFFNKQSTKLWIPPHVTWRLGLSRVGDQTWRNSFDYGISRLSHVDIFLLKNSTTGTFPTDMLPRDIIPVSVCGKLIEVNSKSIETAVAEIGGVNDTFLTALLVSKTVLGRYYTDIDTKSEEWKSVERIILGCTSVKSEEKLSMELRGGDLLDTVQITKTTEAGGRSTFNITTADIPPELTPKFDSKLVIQEKIIPEMKKQAMEKLQGLEFNISIDWNTIESVHDKALRGHLINALLGTSGVGPLAGLSVALDLCADLLQDIEQLYNVETVKDMLTVLKPIEEVQVKYLRALPKAKDTMGIPSDGKIIWYFMLEGGRPRYSSSLFTLSMLLQVFHSVAVSLHSAIYSLGKSPNAFRCGSGKGSKHGSISSQEDEVPTTDISLLVHWKSFGFLSRVKTFIEYVQTAVAPQLLLISKQFSYMLWLELDIKAVTLRNVTSEDEAGIKFTDGILEICFFSYAVIHKPWAVHDIQASKFFQELEVSRLNRKWRAASVNVTASRHRAVGLLLDNLGFPVELPFAGQNMLELLSRFESRQMIHPYELLKKFSSALYNNIAQGYIQSVVTTLSYTEHAHFISRCSAPSGVYCWIRLFEVHKNPAAPKQQQQYLAYHIPPKSTEPIFTPVSKGQLMKISRTGLLGVWERISSVNCFETLNHPRFDKSQIIVMNQKAFLTSPAYIESVITSLPETVAIAYTSGDSKTKNITLEEALTRPLSLPNLRNCSSGGIVNPLSEQFEYLCWCQGMETGFNVIFENFKTNNETQSNCSSFSIPISELVTPDPFYTAYATLQTLKDVSDEALYSKEDRAVIRSAVRSIGTLTIGPSVPPSCIELINGEEHGEYADVYILSDYDLHVMPHGNLGTSDYVGSTFSQTFLVALCNIFIRQAKRRLSTTLSGSISRSISPKDIEFQGEAPRSKQISRLSSTQHSVRALESMVTRILRESSVGTRKLTMDLTGVVFSEHTSGPMVTFDGGILTCPLVKKETEITQKALDVAFMAAVDKEGNHALLNHKGKNEDGTPRERGNEDDDFFHMAAYESCAPYVPGESSLLHHKRIPKNSSDDSHVVELAKKRLFSGVEIGRTSDIIDALDVGADVNSVNSNGETPLIVAARGRNYTLLELLLTRGAQPQRADILGITALHHESGLGDVEAVKLLLSYGADPNEQDDFGRTPLHYAAVGAYQETIDVLVFCGADSSISNKEKETPRSLASGSTKPIKRLMKESECIVKGIKSGNVAIEHLTLQAQTMYQMRQTGLVICTPLGMGLAKTCLMVRKVVPEYSFSGPQVSNNELLLSDVYDFRISGAYVEEPLLLQIPIYNRVEYHEDICVKTDRGIYSTTVKVTRTGNAQKGMQWTCHLRMCLHGIRSVMLVARCRTESIKVTPTGLDYHSTLTPFVRLQFPQGAVERDCHVMLQNKGKPCYEEEEYDSILSLSPFYELTSDSKTSMNKDFTISLPLPENYLGHGILHALMKSQPQDGDDGQGVWSELMRNQEYTTDVLRIKASGLGLFCLLETNPHYHTYEQLGSEVIKMAASLYNKSKRRQYSICFLAMGKAKTGSSNKSEAEIVVECLVATKIHARLQHWRQQGFVDLKPSHTVEFAAFPKQAFVIKASGCCKRVGIDMPPMQFHPKRNNFVKLNVKKIDTDDESGVIELFIRKKQDKTEKLEKSDSVKSESFRHSQESLATAGCQEEMVATIPVFLPWTAPPCESLHENEEEGDLNLSPFDSELQALGIDEDEATTDGDDKAKGKGVQFQSPRERRKSTAQKHGISLTSGSPRSDAQPSSSSRLPVPARTEKKATSSKVPRGSNAQVGGDEKGLQPEEPFRPMRQQQTGLLPWLARRIQDDWLKMGYLLGVPYEFLNKWIRMEKLDNNRRALKMLEHWKETRSTRQDHGVPEILLMLQRTGKTALVRRLKNALRTWIADNLEACGGIKSILNKSLLEDTDASEPMSPIFLLTLVRRIEFPLDFIYELGMSQPEVTRVMGDPLLQHREDRMLKLLLMYKEKERSSAKALEQILQALAKLKLTSAEEWVLTTSRLWLSNHGSADDPFAHAVSDVISSHETTSKTTVNADNEAAPRADNPTPQNHTGDEISKDGDDASPSHLENEAVKHTTGADKAAPSNNAVRRGTPTPRGCAKTVAPTGCANTVTPTGVVVAGETDETDDSLPDIDEE